MVALKPKIKSREATNYAHTECVRATIFFITNKRWGYAPVIECGIMWERSQGHVRVPPLLTPILDGLTDPRAQMSTQLCRHKVTCVRCIYAVSRDCMPIEHESINVCAERILIARSS